jgi:hypothetical protein
MLIILNIIYNNTKNKKLLKKMNLLLIILILFPLTLNAVLSEYEKYNLEMRDKLIAGKPFNITNSPSIKCGFHPELYNRFCWSSKTNYRFPNCCANYISDNLVKIIRGIMYLYETKFYLFLFDTIDEFEKYSISHVERIFEKEDIFSLKFYPWYYPAKINVKFEDIIYFQNLFISYEYDEEDEARRKILKSIYSERLEKNMINEYDVRYFEHDIRVYLSNDYELVNGINTAIKNLHK